MTTPQVKFVPWLPEYLVDICRLDDYIKSLPRGTRNQAREAAAEVFFTRLELSRDPMREYNRGKRAKCIYRVPRELAGALVEAVPRTPVAEPEKLLASWAPESRDLSKTTLSPRQAALGEIEVLSESSRNLIDEAEFTVASRYAAVHVDKVRFFQSRKGSDPLICEGEYLRIEIPSGMHGAVVLPVEQSTGDVLLVTQYRHAAQRFLTECPRGFAHVGADTNEIETARRELAEETGRLPVRTAAGVEELYLLRSSYTDTGKLWEKPSIFLAYVSRDEYTASINAWNPAMEDPVWIRLDIFERALYAERGVELEEGDYHFLRPPRHLEKMRPLTSISKGHLILEDGFTIQAGLLALPRLRERFPKTVS